MNADDLNEMQEDMLGHALMRQDDLALWRAAVLIGRTFKPQRACDAPLLRAISRSNHREMRSLDMLRGPTHAATISEGH